MAGCATRLVIVQSFRTAGAVDWVASWKATVKDWAENNTYAYGFIDDTIFDSVLRRLKEKCREYVLSRTATAHGEGAALSSRKLAFGNVADAAASVEVATRRDLEAAIKSLLSSKSELVNGIA